MHVYTFNLQQKFWSPHEEAKWASKLAKKYSVFLLLRSTFQPSVEKPKKNIKATNKDNIISQWEHELKTSKLPEVRENANDQVAIGF